MDLTNEQWEVLEPLIPNSFRRVDGRGRPWRDSRDVLNGILWVLRTGAPWHDLPGRYPRVDRIGAQDAPYVALAARFSAAAVGQDAVPVAGLVAYPGVCRGLAGHYERGQCPGCRHHAAQGKIGRSCRPSLHSELGPVAGKCFSAHVSPAPASEQSEPRPAVAPERLQTSEPAPPHEIASLRVTGSVLFAF